MVAATVVLVDATDATPIVVATSSAHGFTRPVHGVIDSVTGNTAANDTWVCTPVDDTHLTLSTYDIQGNVVPSVGNGSYVSGGTLSLAFPDGSILLGRRNIAMQSAVATPRIVFVPLGSGEWELDPYGGVIPPVTTLPRRRSTLTAEEQTMLLARQLVTEKQRFEVHVTGAAVPPDPDFGDFDVTQAVYQTLYGVLFDFITPSRARVLEGRWTSQTEDSASVDTHGQKWVGVVEIAQPVTDTPLRFVPLGVVGSIDVMLAGAGSTDDVIITLPGAPP